MKWDFLLIIRKTLISEHSSYHQYMLGNCGFPTLPHSHILMVFIRK